MDMCNDYQKNSVDDDNRRFVPDEVCETLEDAEKTLKWLIGSYSTSRGPFVYPIILNEGINIASHKVLEKNGFKLIFKGIDKYQGKDRALRKYIFER